MGKIDFNDITNFDFKKFNEVSDNFFKIKKSRFSECQKCIARYWCIKCLGNIVISEETGWEEKIINEECLTARKITEVTLEMLGSYITKGNFENLYNNLKKATTEVVNRPMIV